MVYPANKTDDLPVDFSKGTKMIWNGEDITSEVSGSIDASKSKYFVFIGGFYTDDLTAPITDFEIGLPNADEATIDTQIAVFWTSPGPHQAKDMGSGGRVELDH